MLCSLIMRPREEGSRSLLARLERGWNWGFDLLVDGYRRLLQFNEHHRWAAVLILLAVAGIFAHSLWLGGRLGSSAFAESDRGAVYVRLEFPTRYRLDESVRRVREVESRLEGLPELRHILSTVGKVEAILGQSSEGVYLAQILVKFSERTERDITIMELMDNSRERLHGLPDAIVGVSQPSMIGGQSNPVELEIAGDNLQRLDTLVLDTRRYVEEIPGVRDPDTSVRPGKPEIRILPRRSVLSDMGMPVVPLGLTLRANLEGLKAGTFKQGARSYDIVVKLAELPGKDQVRGFQLPGVDGHPLVLTNVSDVVESEMPIQIIRKDKRRLAKLYSQLNERQLPLGAAVARISDTIDQRIDMPPGYTYSFAGTYEFMAEGQQGLAEAGLIAIMLVVLTLAAILESFRQPAIILVTIPLALIGTTWALAAANESFSIFVIMGIVMMVGIVVNNAILIMDQFNMHLQQGVPRHKAMISASCERFRPIVMITLAAVLGMLPMALGTGIGAEMRTGVGIASAGGILVSGVLTLIVLPILYDLMTRKSRTQVESGAEGSAE
jgi:HAE1 family hydrophobic/amphiphilic exporter-1